MSTTMTYRTCALYDVRWTYDASSAVYAFPRVHEARIMLEIEDDPSPAIAARLAAVYGPGSISHSHQYVGPYEAATWPVPNYDGIPRGGQRFCR